MIGKVGLRLSTEETSGADLFHVEIEASRLSDEMTEDFVDAEDQPLVDVDSVGTTTLPHESTP